ncbi:MAG: LegC family aminotransferase [Chthoniobacterales bacterium]
MPSDSDRQFIPLCEPHLAGNEWQYVKECIDTGWVSSVGSYVDRFEKDIARRTGAKHAVAIVNGTSALHIALLICGVRAGDGVLISSMTFIAPANAVRYAGAEPIFVDSESKHWEMDSALIAAFLEKECEVREKETFHCETNRRISAILPVHILGHSVDMDAILELGRRYHLKVIEDATESLGADYKGRPTGTLGDVGCYSFNGNKVITTGGGGMLVTNDANLAARAKHYTTQAKSDPKEYIHDVVGYNYRLTNLQAALGCAQLEQLDSFIEKKRAIAAKYRKALSGLPGISWQQEAEWAHSIDWLFTITVDEKVFGMSARELRELLSARKIQTRCLWQPMHLSPAHSHSTMLGGAVADRLFETALSLPSSVSLSSDQQQAVIEAIKHAAK